VRTTACGVVAAGWAVAVVLPLLHWGMRKTGMSRSGAVMITLATSASTSALVWL
jgi:hypothetical protein